MTYTSATLIAFFSEFTRTAGHRTITPLEIDLGGEIYGLCAVQPEVIFSARTFAFTGASTKGTRYKIEALVARLGGIVCGVEAHLDYLIVGANGNPAWAYSCYGRKVEKVKHLRRDGGAKTLIVYESDFWDAVAVAGGDTASRRQVD